MLIIQLIRLNIRLSIVANVLLLKFLLKSVNWHRMKICPRCRCHMCALWARDTRSPAHGELFFFLLFQPSKLCLVSALEWPPASQPRRHERIWKDCKCQRQRGFVLERPILLFLTVTSVTSLCCNLTVWEVACLGSHAAVIWHRQNLGNQKEVILICCS